MPLPEIFPAISMLFNTPSSTKGLSVVLAVLLCYDQSVAVQAVDVANAKCRQAEEVHGVLQGVCVLIGGGDAVHVFGSDDALLHGVGPDAGQSAYIPGPWLYRLVNGQGAGQIAEAVDISCFLKAWNRGKKVVGAAGQQQPVIGEEGAVVQQDTALFAVQPDHCLSGIPGYAVLFKEVGRNEADSFCIPFTAQVFVMHTAGVNLVIL